MKNLEELFESINENLSGIYSEAITEKEFDLIKATLSEFFVIDESCISTLSVVNDCLELILFKLMEGYGEE